jgi:dihydrofolate reductase
MKAIVAVDLNWGIGYRGNLLLRIPEDMKHFKERTLNRVVIMGQETFESLPGKEPLQNRTNIVLSISKEFSHDGITICRSLTELFGELSKYDSGEVFVIGGESVYRQLLPYCSEVYVTKINHSFAADKYFPNLDQEQGWTQSAAGEAKVHDNIEFRFTKYSNAKVRKYPD